MNVSEIANKVADDIERFGKHNGAGALWALDNPDGPCCIFVNPTNQGVCEDDLLAWERFKDALRQHLVESLPRGHSARVNESWVSIVEWSDYSPQEEVVTTLRNL